MSLHARIRRLCAGADTPARRGLPASELLAPVPLFALALMAVNDWVLTPWPAAPRWLTGKLSDFAGLAVFPLVATAAFDVALAAAAALGARVDDTLRRWKLAAAIALTGAGFAAMKLSSAMADALAAPVARVFGHAEVMADRWDLIALPALGVAWWQGRAAIARGAYGRLAWAKRRRPGGPIYADAIACGADPAIVAELEAATARWLRGEDAALVERALERLRA